MTWKPFSGQQEEFCRRGEFEVLYGGAAGGGKTDCLVALAAAQVYHPRYQAIILRRTFPQLKEVSDRCRVLYPGLGGHYKATERRWYFPSGAYVELGHMQHEDDMYNYQGREFSFVGFDELTQFLNTQYLYLFSRVRSTEPELDAMVRSTTNPGGPGHVDVKERFIDAMPAGDTFIDPVTGLSRAFIPGKVYDNPALMEADPLYISRLEALPDIERARLLDGDWEIFSGQVFPELSKRVHGIDPFDVPPEWERFMVLDWGFAKPFSVGWYAVDYDKNLYRYREWYGCKDGETDVGLRMTASDVARGILERETERVRLRLADPSIAGALPSFRQRETSIPGITIADDMSAQGVHLIGADNDRTQGKLQVHTRLKPLDIVDKETGEIVDQQIHFRVFNDHTHFWRTVPALQADPKRPEDVDTKGEDHIYDEVRYACMSRPMIPRREPREPAGTFQAERRKLIAAKARAKRLGTTLSDVYSRPR